MAKSSLVFYLFVLQHISCTYYLNYVRDTVIIIKNCIITNTVAN